MQWKRIMFLTASKRFSPTALGSVKGLYPGCAGQLHSVWCYFIWLLRFVVPCIFKYSIKLPTDATINRKIDCLATQTPLNMFRALLCPSSGAVYKLQLQPPVAVWMRRWLCFQPWSRLETQPPTHSYGNRRLRLQFVNSSWWWTQ
jgi:hypothetical protein